MFTISIVGVGRLGGALALALDKAGFDVDLLIYRTTKPSEDLLSRFRNDPTVLSVKELAEVRSDIVFITTQDFEIESNEKFLATLLNTSQTVFITSGAMSSACLVHLREKGCQTGSIHPMVSISDPVLGANRFSGAYFCVEGDLKAVRLAESVIGALCGHSFSVAPEMKSLYHASAVMASGDLLALIDMSIGTLEKCGLDRSLASAVLLPLIKSTIQNFTEQGVESSLTGPFVRGDSATFDRHLMALRANSTRTEIQTYLELGERSLEIAMRTRADAPRLAELANKVSMAKKDLR